MNRHHAPDPPHDDRRAERKRLEHDEPVTNVLTGEVMGRVGNISRTGMLLLCPREPGSKALYQCTLALEDKTPRETIEVGLQEQWHQACDSGGQYWAGFRIVAIRDAHLSRLQQWLKHAG